MRPKKAGKARPRTSRADQGRFQRAYEIAKSDPYFKQRKRTAKPKDVCIAGVGWVIENYEYTELGKKHYGIEE